MKKQTIDGVIDAVHLAPGGQLAWARAYQRHGAVFSDYVLLTRPALIAELKAGKSYFIGDRRPLQGHTFNLSRPVRLVQQDGREALVVGDARADQDALAGAPLI